MCIRLSCHSVIKGIHDQRIVIAIPCPERYYSAVKQIQDGTKIDLMDLCADIIPELRYIRQPLLVWGIRMEIPFEVILRDVLRITAALSAALRFPLDRGLDAFNAADTKHAFVVDIYTMPSVKFVPDPSIAHVRMGLMDRSDLL